MQPDLDSLVLFVRAAELRNLTRAAEASAITVPAASRRLALLDHQFKAQLFERHSRGLDLTPAGERLLQLAREVIADVHHVWGDRRRARPRRVVVVPVPPRPARRGTARRRSAGRHVQVRSFETVCRAVEARFGIGVLPLQAARSFAPAMRLRVLPLAEPWARRRMLLCLRGAPAPGSAVQILAAHLAACAAADDDEAGDTEPNAVGASPA